MRKLFQLYSAFITLLLGHALIYLDFFFRGYVHGNTLMYFGQCLIYAGSVLGVKLYIDYLHDSRNNDTNKRG